MTLHNLRDHIPAKILDRARPYIKNGAITSLQTIPAKKSTKYSASVAGKGDHYRVALEFSNDNGEVIFHQCNCPFDGDLCKHQAALLMVLANEETDTPATEEISESVQTKEKDKTPALDALLEKLSEDDLRQYLKHALERYAQLRKDFVATFSSKTAVSKKDYKNIITAALQALRGARSFRDRRAVTRSIEVVYKLLTQAEDVITSQPARTIQIAQAVLEKLVPALQYVDDSGDDLGGCIERAVHYMYLVSETDQDEPLRTEWFVWLLKSAQHKDYQGWDCRWDFANLAALVATANEERKVVALATAMKQQEKEKDDWLAGYTAERAAIVILTFIEKHKSKEEMEAFILQNVHHDGIRRMAFKHYLVKKDYANAIKLCREGINLAAEKKAPGLVAKWYETLLELYQSLGNTEGVIECANYLFHKSHPDMKVYLVLKNNLSKEDWPQQKSMLLQHLEQRSDWHLLATLYVEDKDTVRLLDVLRKTNHLTYLQEFGRHLPDQDKPALQLLYFNLLIKQLELTASRDNYREVAGILKNMRKDFDKQAIANFVSDLKDKYPQRPALLEELSKVD